MRIIKEKFLRESALRYPKSAKYLAAWVATVKAASWENMVELRGCYGSADLVRVGSGKTVVVFNVCGNDYRLIVAMHFKSQMDYTLRFLTHAEYDRNKWKDEL